VIAVELSGGQFSILYRFGGVFFPDLLKAVDCEIVSQRNDSDAFVDGSAKRLAT
jgi:hypothetical protein